VYRKRCVVTNATEGPAFGVALLAAVGTGAYKDVPEACKATITVNTETKPDAKTSKTYDRFYPEYGTLYRSLKDDFRTIASLMDA
jgi:xylulokinase